VALLVDDAYHGRGIGPLLLEELAALARERGIRKFAADTLATNRLMLQVFGDSGLLTERRLRSGVVDVSLDTAPAESAVASADERERLAEERSLGPVLAPRAVAVVGAGRRPGGIGHELLRSIVEGGFTGRVFPVNPHATVVAGVLAYRTIGAVPEPVDLALIAVPAAQVPTAVADCARAGVRGAVVVTSGLGEAGGDGAALQREAVHEARRHGMRITGPNCLGIIDTDPEVSLHATFAPVHPRPGALALASQSGAVGIAVLDHATRGGIGLSEFVSLGNKADVSGNDLLLRWWRHPQTRVIALYLESFGNPRKFGRLARRIGRDKPVLVVKGGRSPGGLRAGASHTAAAATSETAVDALFSQAGVVRVDTIPELLDVAQVLLGQPLPGGDRLGIVGNPGGAGVLAADAAAAAGLEVPQLSDRMQARLRELVPGLAGSGNPVDLGAAASAEHLGRAVEALAGGAHPPRRSRRRAGRGRAPAALRLSRAGGTGARSRGGVRPLAPARCGHGPRAARHRLRGGQGLRGRLPARSRGRWVARPGRGGPAARVRGAAARRGCRGARQTGGARRRRAPRLPGRGFGPVLMLAAGGVLTEVLADRAWRILPLTDVDAEEMLGALRSARLLDGFRGAPPVDRAALLDLLHRAAQLADAVPEIAELDLNPVVVTPEGAVAVDAKIRLAPPVPEPDPYARRLRQPEN